MAVILRAVDDRAEQADARGGSGRSGVEQAAERVVIAERYELLARIGHGATGTVYRAFDRTLDRQVALKLLHAGELEVAEREAQVLAKVTHRNVVTIHDYGYEAGGHRYLVLELLDGRDFRSWLRDRPPVAEIIANFIEAGRGLSAAHRAGLVHRDFKPSNIILTNSGRVVVIDFGLARNLDSIVGELEPVRFAEGTLAYMAPERLAGHDSDERSDQFAFCVALWEALAGSNPFAGDDPLARYRAIRSGPGRASLRVARPIVAGLERGMAFERGDRFSTMDELLRELERPALPERRRGRPVLTAIAIAGTFFIGWGLTPESPVIDEAYSSLDPTIEVGLAMLESAQKRAADGDHNVALEDLLEAAELVISLKAQRGTEDFCTFGAAVPKLADDFLEAGANHQAAVAFAVAARFAQDCPSNIDIAEMRLRKEAAQSRMIGRPKPK